MRGILILFAAGLLVAQTPTPTTPAPAKSTSTSTAKSTKTGTTKAGTAKAGAAKAATAGLNTEEEKAIYALGLSIYKSLGQFDLTPAEVEIVKRAISDSVAGKPVAQLSDWQAKIQPFAQARTTRVATKQKADSQTYLAKAAAEPGASKAASGLIYKQITAGTGATPKSSDTVKVNYRGTFTNGEEFDSSYKRGEPIEFPLTGVIPCWTEGVQKMKVGGKAKLVCPSDIAYGDSGRGPIPGGATLTFEIELLAISNNSK